MVPDVTDLVGFAGQLHAAGVRIDRFDEELDATGKLFTLHATFREHPQVVLSRMFTPEATPQRAAPVDTADLLAQLDAEIDCVNFGGRGSRRPGLSLLAQFSRRGFPTLTVTERGEWAEMRAVVIALVKKVERLESEGWTRVPRETVRGG